VADLKDFYPVGTQPSPRGDGSPASPATASGGGGVVGAVAKKGADPAIWVLIFAAVGLFLLHKA
jgi:hypothetical protein